MILKTYSKTLLPQSGRGFTSVEFLIASVVFGMLVIGLIGAYKSLLSSYATARQLNEIYTVLSACPEIDRALEFSALTSTSNCTPNNAFRVENASGGYISYSPSLTVTNTSSLPASDPLATLPDSKVVDVSVGFPKSSYKPMELRLLITRNGVGQL